jgi:flagellar hook assembly protein FlgD
VEIEVYDVLGRRVHREVLEGQPAGWHRYQFDSRNAGGRRLPAGVYFYRVSALGKVLTKKMVVTR